ncbi:hypothetical protein I6A60_00185 [Frankia sp. AgB1.9]|uniref:hypothetical protein n=1 Tax=unclassified Frankia TaxID=2632575 RepID=UPI001931D757|nr:MULTISPECIES: hypothetical protein [unclassified Frankia]MBL7487298.1 hypothetical protein [Frankia sp. AgW1.1]MBL7546305.1 hypothetical protein [Frankia sp. AgB1.9]MBL7618650.1 hypothetical protein [Frankia sp. AgB1.8]
MSRPPLSRAPLALAGAALTVAALAACSSTAAPAATSTAKPSAGTATVAGDSTADFAAACAALPSFDAAITAYPGADSDGPPPTAAQLTSWASTAMPSLTIIAKHVPAGLDPDVKILTTALEGVSHGTPLNTDDATVTGALTALNKSGHDICGLTKVDVVDNGELTGAPATLPAGPVSISFTNTAPAGQTGFILLVAKIKDGAQVTADQVRTNTVDLGNPSIADIVAVAQPGQDGSAAYTTANLAAGHYILSTPVGTPPAFSKILAVDLQIT